MTVYESKPIADRRVGSNGALGLMANGMAGHPERPRSLRLGPLAWLVTIALNLPVGCAPVGRAGIARDAEFAPEGSAAQWRATLAPTSIMYGSTVPGLAMRGVGFSCELPALLEPAEVFDLLNRRLPEQSSIGASVSVVEVIERAAGRPVIWRVKDPGPINLDPETKQEFIAEHQDRGLTMWTFDWVWRDLKETPIVEYAPWITEGTHNTLGGLLRRVITTIENSSFVSADTALNVRPCIFFYSNAIVITLDVGGPKGIAGESDSVDGESDTIARP